MLLLLGGGLWLSGHDVGVIRDNQITAALMRAYNSADVAPCGDRLCARVDSKAPHYGDKGEYVPIKLR